MTAGFARVNLHLIYVKLGSASRSVPSQVRLGPTLIRSSLKLNINERGCWDEK